MSPEEQHILHRTEQHVRGVLAGDSSGHDWWHIHRVRNLARFLARQEGADIFVVELAALLHDIADWKFHDGDETAGPRAARQWLESQQVAEAVIAEVTDIIATLSFKGAGVSCPMKTLAGQVVQDADRLDALGAIGIARTFAYGGHAGRAMYDPDVQPEHHASFAEYRAAEGTTLNHFTEKLLLLRDRMNTEAARRLAAERHAFLEEFHRRFLQEWNFGEE